ncbi:hypothetical protein ZOSMA_306G00080 [Zostera marina]|uniref:Uncharacterized protein n=1 Tax=Zostera marina TaxID=29655 RepID=A0A0K9P9Z8_ZOSMR|nr:hypothetical protein ZOSMA_306G00080 [Zostera marina]
MMGMRWSTVMSVEFGFKLCSDFVKGDASFTCGKWKIRDIRNNYNNEENVVAQLLVEFPNKADLCPSLVRPSFGVWREIPMEERRPALFQEISTVFTYSLWKIIGKKTKFINFFGSLHNQK